MDILTDILNSSGLSTSLLTKHAFYDLWAMRFPCNKSMGFHLVTQGTAYIKADKIKEPLILNKGDLVMIKRGLDHEIATDLKAKAKNFDPSILPINNTIENRKPVLTLVSGLYQFRTEPIHPLFSEIPNFIVIRAEELAPHNPLFIAQQLLSMEMANKTNLGTDAITKSLVDVLFHYIFRNWLDKKPEKKSCWSLALKDSHLQRALAALHEKPQYPWSLEELSEVAGVSRAAFALKFKKITGDTPAHYLTRIRIQHSMDLLRTSRHNLDKIAETVGYGDSFIFSKAFKRTLGISPKEYRKQFEDR